MKVLLDLLGLEIETKVETEQNGKVSIKNIFKGKNAHGKITLITAMILIIIFLPMFAVIGGLLYVVCGIVAGIFTLIHKFLVPLRKSKC